jgi:hypothetical protein
MKHTNKNRIIPIVDEANRLNNYLDDLQIARSIERVLLSLDLVEGDSVGQAQHEAMRDLAGAVFYRTGRAMMSYLRYCAERGDYD